MVCSFTGHRTIPSSHAGKIGELLARAVEYAYGEGCRIFQSGGAIGFDQLAAREVLRFRISHPDVKLNMVLPCLDQSSGWSAAQIDAYEYILKCADSVEYVGEEYTNECMRNRNYRLAETCDILIAYVGYSRSGSAQTMRFAQKMEKRVYNLHPALEKTR
jgi:uncharacterized phage-like protein YoqJ